MAAELDDVVDECDIPEDELTELEQAAGQLDTLLHNRKMSVRIKEKHDLEYRLEMSHYAEDILEQKKIIESYIEAYPKATKTYKNWLTRHSAELRGVEAVEP